MKIPMLSPLILAVLLLPLASSAACDPKFLIKYSGSAAYHTSVSTAVKTSTSEVFTAGEIQQTATTDLKKASILKTNTMGVETGATTISHTSPVAFGSALAGAEGAAATSSVF